MDYKDTYKTKDLFDILGVSRDALRYYEEKGIIKPRLDSNNYRQYDFFDIYTLLFTDFYKKRNFSIKEIKDIKAGNDLEEIKSSLDDKAKTLEEEIKVKRHMLKKIKDTKKFCNSLNRHLNKYTIKALAPFKIKGEISDFDSVYEYPSILDSIDLKKEDIISMMRRKFSFNETGFTGFNIYIVEDAKASDRDVLNYSKCIYTVVEDGRSQGIDVKVKAFQSTLMWAKEQGYEPIGEAYANTRLITYTNDLEKIYVEIYIPIK